MMSALILASVSIPNSTTVCVERAYLYGNGLFGRKPHDWDAFPVIYFARQAHRQHKGRHDGTVKAYQAENFALGSTNTDPEALIVCNGRSQLRTDNDSPQWSFCCSTDLQFMTIYVQLWDDEKVYLDGILGQVAINATQASARYTGSLVVDRMPNGNQLLDPCWGIFQPCIRDRGSVTFTVSHDGESRDELPSVHLSESVPVSSFAKDYFHGGTEPISRPTSFLRPNALILVGSLTLVALAALGVRVSLRASQQHLPLL